MSLEIKEPTAAGLMDPGDKDNIPDASGNGIEWEPTEVLSAAESPAKLTDSTDGENND